MILDTAFDVPEVFRALLVGDPGAEDPKHGDLIPPIKAWPGDYVLDESGHWARITEPPIPVDGGTLLPTAVGKLEFPRGRHAWVWSAADLKAHLARGGELA